LDKPLTIASSSAFLAKTASKHIVNTNDSARIVKLKGNYSFDSIKSQLMAKDFDFAVINLADAPFNLPDGLVLAGVSERKDASLKFLGNPDCLTGESLRDIKKGAKIKVRYDIVKDQLLELFEDLEVITDKNPITDFHKDLESGNIDGYIRAKFEFEQINLPENKFYEWDFSPHEIVSKGGEGVAAYLCRMDDILHRKIIRSYHHSPTSVCTNVERKITRAFPNNPIGAYCFMDSRNNYQIHSSVSLDKNHRSFYSQSTSDSLADKILELLQNETNVPNI